MVCIFIINKILFLRVWGIRKETLFPICVIHITSIGFIVKTRWDKLIFKNKIDYGSVNTKPGLNGNGKSIDLKNFFFVSYWVLVHTYIRLATLFMIKNNFRLHILKRLYFYEMLCIYRKMPDENKITSHLEWRGIKHVMTS